MEEADELANLRAERDALAARLRNLDTRDLVAELRAIYNLTTGDAERLLRALLRRLDESQ